jgi:PAS domain S-box-containing protein
MLDQLSSRAHALIILGLSVFLSLVALNNFILFHTLAELIAIFIGFGIFLFCTHTRKLELNGFYQIIGIVYLYVALVDIVHMLSYEDMGIISYSGADETIETWLYARSIEVLALIAAPFFITTHPPFKKVFSLTLILFVISAITFYFGRAFLPIFFIPGEGLTYSKKLIEFVFIALLIIPLVKITREGGRLTPETRHFFKVSVVMTMLSELCLSLYTDLFGISNVLGHLFKIISFIYIYRLMIEVTLRDSLATIFHKLIDDQQLSLTKLRASQRESVKYLRELINYKRALDDDYMISMTNLKGVITYVNDNFCKISGYKREELIGKTHRVLRTDHHNDEYYKELYSKIYSKNSADVLFKNIKKDGTLFWCSGIITPFLDPHGNIESFFFLSHDVTEQKELETLYYQNQKLSAIGELTAQVLHDMANPLALITLAQENCQTLIDRLTLNEEDRRVLNNYMHTIEDNTDRMHKFFKNLRSHLVSTENDNPIERSPVEKILRRAAHLCDHKIRTQKVRIDIQADQSVEINCVPDQLVQVFINLINNSLDALLDQEHGWIHLSAIIQNNHCLIHVIDNGSGISPENQPKIFDRLFTTKKAEGGTGLGMRIVKTIIEANKGSIEYDPKSPFTQFIITFPLAHHLKSVA